MTSSAKTRKRRSTTTLAGFLALVLLGHGTPARAQFSWFGPSEASPQDVYDTISEHGFRLVGPLYRNGRVYIADVVDRRQRRERLVVSAENGQIVQRYLVEVGGSERRQALAERPRPEPRDNSFFSNLTRGWDDEPPPRPPLAIPGQDSAPSSVVVPRVKPRPEPRVVTRTEIAPVTTAPLAPAPGPDRKTTPADKKPDAPSTPAPAATVPSPVPVPSGRATTVVNDPLKIPGVRRTEESKPAAVATVKPPEPAPAKPAPAKATDVPVAPLD